MTETFYWYDFESWGINPKKDRPSQFAGIRTDKDLNIIGEPLVIYCQIPNDYLPNPEAALVTGITPQKTLAEGLIEPEFFKQIHGELSVANTISVGYNNIRFDDEMIRYGLYRNFYDPYAYSWQNGNSRWDLLDVLRACYALRPEGIEWPVKEDGSPSFKLDQLTIANGIEHSNAHDALADVIATIEMAKLVKSKQPKLYGYLVNHRSKQALSNLIDFESMTPLVHTSGMFSALQGCTSWVVPLAPHPTNKNAVISYNLTQDPSLLLALSTEEIITKLYTKTEDIEDERVGLKLIHLNKCPILAPAKTLLPEVAERLGIDREKCLSHLNWLKQHPEIKQKLIQVFNEPQEFQKDSNPEYRLYDGFISNADKFQMQQITDVAISEQGKLTPIFNEERLNGLWKRYKARYFSNELNEQELNWWQNHRKEKLVNGIDSPNLTFEEYQMKLENLATEQSDNKQTMAMLKALYLYAQNL